MRKYDRNKVKEDRDEFNEYRQQTYYDLNWWWDDKELYSYQSDKEYHDNSEGETWISEWKDIHERDNIIDALLNNEEYIPKVEKRQNGRLMIFR